jgi:hypothetical protein
MPHRPKPSELRFEEACRRAPFAPLIHAVVVMAGVVGSLRRAREEPAKAALPGPTHEQPSPA